MLLVYLIQNWLVYNKLKTLNDLSRKREQNKWRVRPVSFPGPCNNPPKPCAVLTDSSAEVVYITCAPMCILDKSERPVPVRWERRKHLCCCGAGIKVPCKYLGKKMQVKLSRPTRDPAMNPVTALATFGIGRILAANVGIVVTCADVCKNVGNVGPTFRQILSSGPCQTTRHVMSGRRQPTRRLILLDIKKKKTAKLRRNSCGSGVIWCKKVTKMVSYALIHVYVPFFS